MSKGVKNLLIANILVFFFSFFAGQYILENFVLFSEPSHFDFYQLFSYMFLHVSFTHILLNMIGLVVFGNELESEFGTDKFLLLYFISGVFAGLSHILFSSTPVVGASGAVWGLMATYAIMFPNRKLYLYFLIPVKTKYIIGTFLILEFIFLNSNDGTSHLAHIGGAVSGSILYLLYLRNND